MNTLWRRRLCRLTVIVWIGGVAGASTARGGEPSAEIAVAIRYFQESGESHAHLYLYLENGHLLRALTDDAHAQDRNPVFAPDGATIVFTRVHDAGGTDYWSIEPRGGNLHVLTAAPDWYAATKTSPFFTDPPEGEDHGDPPTYRATGGPEELILKTIPGDEFNDIDGEGHGQHYLWNHLRTDTYTELGKVPGFVGLWGLLECAPPDGPGYFLTAMPLRAAFFNLHLNSTDGDTVFALDFEGKRLVRLSPNYAMPILLPGEAAFLTLTEQRYVPYGDGKHTANCSYLEHWDARFNKVRYARENAAALCYGASMYRPGKTPAGVNLHSGSL